MVSNGSTRRRSDRTGALMMTSGSAAGSLVGREHEREVLQDFVRRVTDGDGGALLVSGEPGVGKTALLTATAARGAA